MPKVPAVHPCLPKALLEEFRAHWAWKLPLEASRIYSDEFRPYHSAVVGEGVFPGSLVEGGSPHIPGVPQDLIESLLQYGRKDRRTFLHFAASTGDVLLAYECVRLGIDVNIPDASGATPLMIACLKMFQDSVLEDMVVKDGFTSFPPFFGPEANEMFDYPAQSLQDHMQRCASVAKMLVQQHANVNIRDAASGGKTPLLLACGAQQWSVVEILLEHGADPTLHGTPDLVSLSTNLAYKRKISTLLAAYSLPKLRPPRLCPCFSGETLANCHAAHEQPYPDHFICTCGSGKVYEKCCAKRSMRVLEVWSEKDGMIITPAVWSRRVTLGFQLTHPELGDVLAAFQQYMKKRNSDAAFDSTIKKSQARHMCMIFEKLAVGGRADPAFVSAMGFPCSAVVMPFDHSMPKIGCKKSVAQWNTMVDIYISLGVDGRSRGEIEREAKVGLDGGPLFKRCEAVGCKKVESDDKEKFKCCSSCKRIIYCSTACQNAHWRSHKRACKEVSHPLQLLPSQAAFKAEIDAMLVDCLKRIQKLDDYEKAFEGDAMDAAGVTLATSAMILSVMRFFRDPRDSPHWRQHVPEHKNDPTG